MGKIAKQIPNTFKQKNPKNKKTKSTILFDEKQREDFLKGFSQRKQERKRIANETIIEKLKEEKRQLKIKKRQELNEKWEKLNLRLDFDHLAEEKKVYDLAKHTVTVTEVSGASLVAHGGVHLGTNQESEDDNSEMSGTEEVGDVSSDEEVFGRKPQASLQPNNSEEAQEEEEDSKSDAKKKRPYNANKHKNMSHLMTKAKLAKARKKRKLEAKMPQHLRQPGSRKPKKRTRNARG